MNKLRGAPNSDSKSGFTIIEVMLVLAITGLMLVGILGGTYSSIATQRYNDSVRSFSDFLNQLYSEVISPQSLGAGNSDDDAVYGKLAVFGYQDSNNNDVVYTATVVGDPDANTQSDFLKSLQVAGIKLFCGAKDPATGAVTAESTFDTYVPMWEAKIQILDPASAAAPPALPAPLAAGTHSSLLIARSPATGVVHTAFSPNFGPDLKSNCNPDNAASVPPVMYGDVALAAGRNNFAVNPVDFCIVSDNSRVVRDIRLDFDGHNSSAINLIPADGDVKCAQK